MTAAEIIEKYEVPKEWFEVVFEAYAEGAKRGYIEGSIAAYNAAATTEAKT
jgi:hypothetical protein